MCIGCLINMEKLETKCTSIRHNLNRHNLNQNVEKPLLLTYSMVQSPS
jgi:hypothetical protein